MNTKKVKISKLYSQMFLTAGMSVFLGLSSYGATMTPSNADAAKTITDKYADIIEDESLESLYNKTIEICKEKLQELEENGIHMSVANTKDSVRSYIRNYLPKPDGISIEVGIYNSPSGLTGSMDFKPAIAGTPANRYGEEGQCYVSVIIDYDQNPGLCWLDSNKIRIIPLIYSGDFDYEDEDSSESSSVIWDNGLIIKGPNIYDGQWTYTNNNWHLRLSNNLMATSQWAYIKDKWYLFDNEVNMITIWKKVDGKWYYLTQSGEMVTGWNLINNTYYFMDSNGVMLQDTTTPDGYRVNKNGEWIH